MQDDSILKNNLHKMRAIYINVNEVDNLKKQLSALELDKQVQAILFFMADKKQLSRQILSPILKKNKKPIIGGIFPELIFMGERKNEGILLLPLSFKLKTQLFDLSESTECYYKQLEKTHKDSLDASSALFVFTDALGQNKESFIETLFDFFGINPTYIGGGAGSLSFVPFPCIINNNGLHENAAVIAWANKKISLGVAHGWNSISKPLKVTKTSKNILECINWNPAFEVYRHIVESHSEMKFTKDNFFQIAKSYPLGIEKIDGEMVVRDPYMTSNNAIYLVDLINEGEYIHILHGDMDSLLEGASKAKEIAFAKRTDSMSQKSVFCIDCISRVLYMQDDFKKELDAMGHNTQVNGILSIGEIANPEDSFLEIYNKTIVIGIW